MVDSDLEGILCDDEGNWVACCNAPDTGAWLVRYARAVNALDVAPLARGLAPEVSYESQSVFDRMVGRERLLAYWHEKFDTIRRAGNGIAAELARLPDGQPCVALYQGASLYDSSWLDAPLALMTIRTNARGEAESFLMITCAPAPDSAQGSSIYPGRAGPPVAHPKRFVRASPDFDQIALYVFYLDGTLDLDRLMAEAIAQARRELPGICIAEASYKNADRCSAWPVVHTFGFTGFPSVGALFRGEPIYRHQGLISGPDLVAALREATPLFVAASATGQDGASHE